MITTQSEAHAEWHRNAGVPMGTPGCPQDACHQPDDWEPEAAGAPPAPPPDPGTDPVGAAKAGYFRAVFPDRDSAAAFYARITGAAPNPWTGQYDRPGAWYVTDVAMNRRGGRIVTFRRDREVPDEPGIPGLTAPRPGWQTYWQDMALTVGSYGSTFGEPPTGAGRKTATLNGMPCPAEM